MTMRIHLNWGVGITIVYTLFAIGTVGVDGWKPEAKDLKPLADDLAVEYSVTHLPGLKRYAAVYTELGLSDRIVARFAESPEGPWSEAVLLYTWARRDGVRRDGALLAMTALAANAGSCLAGLLLSPSFQASI